MYLSALTFILLCFECLSYLFQISYCSNRFFNDENSLFGDVVLGFPVSNCTETLVISKSKALNLSKLKVLKIKPVFKIIGGSIIHHITLSKILGINNDKNLNWWKIKRIISENISTSWHHFFFPNKKRVGFLFIYLPYVWNILYAYTM